MEMLTYSLWFTLIWWCATLICTTRLGDNTIEFNEIIPHFVTLPSIAMLVEYLIVR